MIDSAKRIRDEDQDGATKRRPGTRCGTKYCLGVKFENYRNELIREDRCRERKQAVHAGEMVTAKWRRQ
jgi:hypothetical protein